MEELHTANDIVDDPDALRDRIRDDGYVFVRGLLDAELVRGVGREAAAALQTAGWTSAGGDPLGAAPLEPIHAVAMRDAIGDPGYRAFALLEGFNMLPYLEPFEAFMHRLAGPSAFCRPRKVPRVVYPAAMVPRHPGAVVHKDYSGVQDMFTCWVPLIDVPVSDGGLAVLPGSQRWVRFRPRSIGPDEQGWCTTHYTPGDVLVFHCLTTHAALPNRGQHLRLSGEYRWQPAEEPVPRMMVQGRDGRELYSRVFGRTSWWHPVPPNLRIVDMARDDGRRTPPTPSRFVDFTDLPAGSPRHSRMPFSARSASRRASRSASA
jgi:hypothetical protein